MIEKIFLTYANHSLINKPQNFHATVDQIDQVFSMPREIKSSINQSIELIIRFAKFNDFNRANEYKKKIKKQFNPLILESNFEYVYGYFGGVCHGVCQQGKIDRPKTFENGKFTEPDRIKCFECDQKYFNYVLSNIMSGKEYSEIIGFSYFLEQQRNLIKTNVTISDGEIDSVFKEVLVKVPFWEPLLVNFLFYAFIQGVVSYSLSEFLLNDNRIKIRLCNHCENFFIASKADQRIKFCQTCSPKSKMSKEQRNIYQRNRYWKKKKEKLAKEHEAKIANYMNKLGCTRKEAEGIIKADSIL